MWLSFGVASPAAQGALGALPAWGAAAVVSPAGRWHRTAVTTTGLQRSAGAENGLSCDREDRVPTAVGERGVDGAAR